MVVCKSAIFHFSNFIVESVIGEFYILRTAWATNSLYTESVVACKDLCFREYANILHPLNSTVFVILKLFLQ